MKKITLVQLDDRNRAEVKHRDLIIKPQMPKFVKVYLLFEEALPVEEIEKSLYPEMKSKLQIIWIRST